MGRQRIERALLYVTAWSPVALAFAFALAVTTRSSWQGALLAAVTITVPAALLALVFDALVPRLTGPATPRWGSMLVPVLSALAFSALWCAAIVLSMWWFQPPATTRAFLASGMAWQLVMGVVLYAVLAGIRSARTARASERRRTRDLERSESLRLRAELSALRGRLDPHFLFNVLQTLGALIDERPSEAHRALEYLAGLLRRRLDASGDEDDDLTTLQSELVDARQYLALEALRWGDRLEVRECIDPSTLGFTVPRFTLQPLVENAVRHGIAPKASGGRVELSSLRVDDRLWRLRVADDGAGADQSALTAPRGIGVKTVRERFRLHYGDEAEVRIESSVGAGFSVIVDLRMEQDRPVDDVTADDGAR